MRPALHVVGHALDGGVAVRAGRTTGDGELDDGGAAVGRRPRRSRHPRGRRSSTTGRCRGCRRRCRCGCPPARPSTAGRGSAWGRPRLASSVSPIALWIANITPMRRPSSTVVVLAPGARTGRPATAVLLRIGRVEVVDPVAAEVLVERHPQRESRGLTSLRPTVVEGVGAGEEPAPSLEPGQRRQVAVEQDLLVDVAGAEVAVEGRHLLGLGESVRHASHGVELDYATTCPVFLGFDQP